MRPVILNKYRDAIPESARSIMRDSQWGNPHPLKKFKNNRQLVVQMYVPYLDDLLTDPEIMERFVALAKVPYFYCVCKPQLCHGDVILAKMEDLGLIDLHAGQPIHLPFNR